MWWFLAFGFVGCLLFLLILGRRNEQEVERDWEMLLSPQGAQVYQGVESQLRGQFALADIAYEEAFALRELGSVEEAKELLESGYKILDRFCPSMFKLLTAMSIFSRMVAAVAPIRPLRPSEFKLAQLASLAHLNRLMHHFLVSGGERFRLRVYIIGRSVALATRVLLRSTHKIVQGTDPVEQEWKQVQAVRDDMATLANESLSSLRTLMTSLAAERKDSQFTLPLNT